MTVDQAKKHYHIGGKTFYDAVNSNNIQKVRKGNYVYFPIKDMDRLFKDKTSIDSTGNPKTLHSEL